MGKIVIMLVYSGGKVVHTRFMKFTTYSVFASLCVISPRLLQAFLGGLRYLRSYCRFIPFDELYGVVEGRSLLGALTMEALEWSGME